MFDRNPRFPHRLSVKRALTSNGEPVFDEYGNPVYQTVVLAIVALSDGYMMRDADGNPIISDYAEEIQFGYRTNSRNAQTYGDVVNYDRELHCPPFLAELTFDDIVEITDYDRTYKARLVDKRTFNWGTNLFITEIKN